MTCETRAATCEYGIVGLAAAIALLMRFCNTTASSFLLPVLGLLDSSESREVLFLLSLALGHALLC
jgi:hypothetical protein